jgi:hypothetical protein
MYRWYLLLAGVGLLFASCRPSDPGNWKELIPERAPFLIVMEENSTLNEMLNAPYMPFFEDVSSSAIQLTGELIDDSGVDIPLIAILLYPDTANDWQPVWITESVSGLIGQLISRFQLPFAQNEYHFRGHTIQKLFISERVFYIIDTGSYTLVSESSFAIEEMLRTYHGELEPMLLTPEQISPGSFVINTPNLERWAEQMAQVTYRPYLLNAFSGSGSLSANLSDNNPTESLIWMLSGEMPVYDNPSPLIRGISAESRDLQLDRYISTNAAAFSIFQLEPRMIPAEEEPIGSMDQFLSDHTDQYRNIASALDTETAFVAFSESGFMSSSEFLFLRKLNDPAQFRSALNSFATEDLIQRDDNIYIINSLYLGKLIGSDLSTIRNFYLTVHGNTAAISRSRNLVETIGLDHDRRRVMYYDDHYMQIRESFPANMSSLTYVDTPNFNSYIQPWLYPQNYFGALSSNLEILTIITGRESSDSPLKVDISSHVRETTEAPYRERWIYPFASDMTGTPVLANIGGSSRDEIIFTTANGSTYAIATDGTVVMQASTSTDTPIGSPVVYDWYGNNLNVILQAAGNKIYAWNEAGRILPNFPIELNENITTQIQVEDVTRNGVPEIIVTTADRNVHILDSRGDNISGWPQMVNSSIQSKPVISMYDQQRTLFAFSENGLHAWNINGSRISGFPVFIEAQYNGSPVIHNNHIIGAASDGNLYATGTSELFADSLAASTSGDSLITQSLNISNSSLNQTPAVYNEMIRVNDELVREDLILTQSSNGSVMIFNTEGQLRFSQNMGQPASENFAPRIMDINGNNRRDVVSLADYGRLYAWDLISGARIYDLPTSGMRFPLFYDLNRDGNIEIIAQTREGLRTWTVFRL